MMTIEMSMSSAIAMITTERLFRCRMSQKQATCRKESSMQRREVSASCTTPQELQIQRNEGANCSRHNKVPG